MKYNITTFGCQMNEHDSEKLAGILEDMGYTETDTNQDADVIIINTCSVRENADKRFFGTLGQLKHLKKNNPGITIAVCGCMMQQQHIVDTIKGKYPFVDMVFGTHNLHDFPNLLSHSLNERHLNISVWEAEGEIVEGLPAKRKHDFKAFVNIMYGCNNFCTYCIVPYTRGRERSRKPDEIIKEITELGQTGTKEVVLLGQNVNSYGLNSDFDLDFAGLLYKINDIEGIERIRFMTSHPKDLSDNLIKAFKECNKVCHHIHLPIQSGSTRILERMNRKYTREDYLELVRKIKEAVPDIAITTDFIVGFPGETEEDFAETLDMVNQVQFASAFTFLYSVRKGTPAENYEEQVDEQTKHRRFNELVKLLNDIALVKNSDLKNKVVDVLVEGRSKTDETKLSGRTSCFKQVNFSGGSKNIGKIVPVKITGAKTFSLTGEIVSEI